MRLFPRTPDFGEQHSSTKQDSYLFALPSDEIHVLEVLSPRSSMKPGRPWLSQCKYAETDNSVEKYVICTAAPHLPLGGKRLMRVRRRQEEKFQWKTANVDFILLGTLHICMCCILHIHRPTLFWLKKKTAGLSLMIFMCPSKGALPYTFFSTYTWFKDYLPQPTICVFFFSHSHSPLILLCFGVM